SMNSAETRFVWSIVTVQSAVPEQAPDQPANRELLVWAVSVTVCPTSKFALHAPGQSIRPMLLVTFPAPLPVVATVGRGRLVGRQLSATACVMSSYATCVVPWSGEATLHARP